MNGFNSHIQAKPVFSRKYVLQCIERYGPDLVLLQDGGIVSCNTWFVQKVSGLTTVHEADKAYGVLTLIVFNTVPLRSYTLRPFLPLLETFCELLFRDV